MDGPYLDPKQFEQQVLSHLGGDLGNPRGASLRCRVFNVASYSEGKKTGRIVTPLQLCRGHMHIDHQSQHFFREWARADASGWVACQLTCSSCLGEK